jgi:hypothetical protein
MRRLDGGASLPDTHSETLPPLPSAPVHTAWWKWTAPLSGFVTIDTEKPWWSPVRFNVYRGRTMPTLSQVVAEPIRTSDPTRVFEVVEGTSYALALDDPTGVQARVQIRVRMLNHDGHPSNDNYADRIPLYGGTVGYEQPRFTPWDADYRSATLEPGEPLHQVLPDATSSVWWSFEPWTPGYYTVGEGRHSGPFHEGHRVALYRPASTIADLEPLAPVLSSAGGAPIYYLDAPVVLASVSRDRWPTEADPRLVLSDGYDLWQGPNFLGTGLDPAPLAMPLGDGMTNLEKFVFDLDPRSAVGGGGTWDLNLPSFRVHDNHMEFSVHINPASQQGPVRYGVRLEEWRPSEPILGITWTHPWNIVSVTSPTAPDHRLIIRIPLDNPPERQRLFRWKIERGAWF